MQYGIFKMVSWEFGERRGLFRYLSVISDFEISVSVRFKRTVIKLEYFGGQLTLSRAWTQVTCDRFIFKAFLKIDSSID